MAASNYCSVVRTRDVQSELMCAICKENVKDKLLKECGHSFCKDCLKKHICKGKIVCALCRKVTLVRTIDDLQDNYVTKGIENTLALSSLSLNEDDSGDASCAECTDRIVKAVAFCKDCDSAICRQCEAEHSKKKRLLSHMIVPLDERDTECMQLFVKTMDDKTLSIIVSGPGDSVNNLKNKVFKKTGIPENEIRLIFAGRQLESGKLLSDYNVGKHNTLHMVLRLKGGKYITPKCTAM